MYKLDHHFHPVQKIKLDSVNVTRNEIYRKSINVDMCREYLGVILNFAKMTCGTSKKLNTKAMLERRGEK